MRAVLVAAAVVSAGVAVRMLLSAWSRLGIHQGYAAVQPILFPHDVHATKLEIPCLYCHSAARTSRHAGIPPASVCMNCHSMLEKQTVEIEKLKEAVVLDKPIPWIAVHSLPDYVYFNHSAH